jgi:hypothetical protein
MVPALFQLCTIDLIVTTSLDQVVLILKASFTFFTKRATFQLVVTGGGNSGTGFDGISNTAESLTSSGANVIKLFWSVIYRFL